MERSKIQLLPRISEKTYGLSEARVYVVNVPKGANKHTVKHAIESQFSVKVVKVNLTNIPGKAKRTVSKNGRRVANGVDKDVRKAYVTLAEGNNLPFFAAIEEEEKQAEKVQEEMSKQLEKESKKEEKDSKPKRRNIRKPKASEEKE